MKIVHIRDDLTNIINLITVCRLALLAENDQSQIAVANTLFFDVVKQLQILDENLQQIQEK
jgi:hypothetical protein